MNERLLRALRREPVDTTPVWFMRQAGRSLPKYRASRANRAVQEIIRDPRAAAEITALPLEYYPVDAAVLFSDLSTPYAAAGFDVEILPNRGPVVSNPIRSAADVDRLRPFDAAEDLDFVLEQIALLAPRLEVPIIGFVGAPFTLCSYLIAGPRTALLESLKVFVLREPEAWHRLAEFWAVQLAEFGVAQHRAGASAVQVFDSWAGVLDPDDYAKHVLPHSRRLLARLAEAGVPTIHFATGNPQLLPLLARAGGDGISVDWRVPIDEAIETIGPERAIQGNLDPVALLAGEKAALAKTRSIMERVDGRPGHIFNLGHGILPETDHRVVRSVVEAVHAFGKE